MNPQYLPFDNPFAIYRQKTGKDYLKLAFGYGEIMDPVPELAMGSCLRRYITYQHSSVMIITSLFWLCLLTLYNDIMTFRTSEEWIVSSVRYLSYPITFGILIMACRAENAIIQSRLVCAAWIVALIPFLILVANPFLYEFIGHFL